MDLFKKEKGGSRCCYSIGEFSNSNSVGVHPFRHFFRHFRFWRFRHPYKTLGPPLYLKSFRFGTNILRFGTNYVFFGTKCVRFGTKTKNYFSSHLGGIFISSIKSTTSTSA
jgi:hypothetical protein